MNRHVRSVHEGKKPFMCEICSSRFSEKCYLNSHIAHVHEKKLKFTCDICKKGFSQKGALVRHNSSVYKVCKPPTLH